MKVNFGKYKKNGKERTEKVEIHDWDTFSADHTLSLIIHPLLVRFKEVSKEKGGVPSDFLETVDVSEMTEEEAEAIHEKLHDEAEKRWHEILDKMIWSFNEIKNNYEGEEAFFSINEDVPEEDIENRYDMDKNGLNDYYEKIDEGLTLFGRYYRSLWW